MSYLRLIYYLICASCFTGCLSHINIPEAPSRHDLANERIEYYQTYGLKDGGAGITGLRLKNEQWVEAVEDLLPAVDSKSDFARYVSVAQTERRQARFWQATGASLFFGSAGYLFVNDKRDENFEGSTAFVTGLGAMIFGVILTAYPPGSSAYEDAAKKAVRTYDEALEEQLGIDSLLEEYHQTNINKQQTIVP